MSRTTFTYSAFALTAAALASAATAGTINISQIGGGFLLNSGPAPFGFGPAGEIVLGNAINASGVATDGKITFAAIDTGSGLGMVALIDRAQTTQGTPLLGDVHFDGTGPVGALPYSSDAGVVLIPSPPTAIATGDFTWNSNGDGDEFGWQSLVSGNVMTWRFQRNGTLGLDDPNTFQFVTWTGTTWALVSTPYSFSANGEFGYSANVAVPAPASLLGLAGAVALRRRRRR